MSITDTIATLKPLTDQQKAAAFLWEVWITADVEARAKRLGVPVSSIDPAQLERFKIEAILYRLAHPDDATQVDVQVDDARISKRYQSSTGQLTYLDDWWDWLGLTDTGSGSCWSIHQAYGGRRAWY